MSRKGRLAKSNRGRSVSSDAKRVPSAIAPDGVGERLQAGRSESLEAPSRSTQTAFGSPALSEPPDRDELSVPPVDIDAHFFGAIQDSSEALGEFDGRDPRAARKMSPTAARRRAHLAKYVKMAVALSSALCVAALVKAGATGGHAVPSRAVRPSSEGLRPIATSSLANSPEGPPSSAAPGIPPVAVGPLASVMGQTAAPLAAEASAARMADPAPVQSATIALPSSATAISVRTPVARSATSAAPTSTDSETLPPDPKAAARAKAASTNALERGDVALAIDAGERSVALDPTDGEAWLVLGAAYQQKGDTRGAIRSFKACLQEGKRGPRGECAAMLR